MATKLCACGKKFEAEEDWKVTCYDCYKKKKSQDKKDAKDVEIGTKEADEKYNVVGIGVKTDSRQLAIFRGQCLNIATQLSLKKNMEGNIDYIYDLAEKIYKKGMERRYV